MTELNNSLYNASYQALTEHGVPEYLADVASRIVAADQPGEPNLGRSDIDNEITKQVVEIINVNLGSR